MTDKRAYQSPADFSEFTPAGDDDEGRLDAERLVRMAEEQDAPPSDEEELKQALRDQQHAEHFLVPDPSDDLTDDELFNLMPKPWDNA